MFSEILFYAYGFGASFKFQSQAEGRKEVLWDGGWVRGDSEVHESTDDAGSTGPAAKLKLQGCENLAVSKQEHEQSSRNLWPNL